MASRFYLATVAMMMIAVQASLGLALDDGKPEGAAQGAPATPRLTRAELKEKQLDVSLEARDIERILAKLKKASELSKQRIADAAKTAESASTSLDKGDSKAALSEAKQTTEMFKEIVQQLQALLKEETPQRIAEARQLAAQLAKAERQFAQKFQGALNPNQAGGTKGKIDPKSQIAPMTNPDSKAQGGGGKSKSQNGTGQGTPDKNEAGKNETEDEKNKNGGKSGDSNDLPSGTKPSDSGSPGENAPKSKGAGGSKDKDKDKEPMPDAQGGSGSKNKDDSEKNSQSGGSGSDKNENGDKPDKPSGGSGKQQKEQKDKSEPKEGGNGADQNQDQEGMGGAGGKPLTPEQLRELVANRAEKLAESGRTLQDVLNEISKSSDPADKDAVGKVAEIMKEIDINKLVGEMGQISNLIRSQRDTDAKLSSLDLAERLEIMAQRLDGAYRAIVAPQAEELRKLEQALADLREELTKLETPAQVAAWHREARQLLDQLDKLGVNLKAREEFEIEMKKAGFGVDADPSRLKVNWGLTGNRYEAPVGYNGALIHLQEDIQERIQTLILGDIGNVSDDATPPKYQEFVERYYEVLSGKQK